MSIGYLAIFAFVPIFLALVLMVGFKLAATKAMPIAWASCFFIGIVVWKMPMEYLAALTLQGVVNALSILVFIFGALLILHTLTASGGMETIQWGMQQISPDMRIQGLIIGFMYAAFIEGTAGFGTPSALAAPLLLALGYPPMAAAVLCLAFNSFPVTFGGAGVPIMIGFGGSIQNVMDALVSNGSYPSVVAFLNELGENSAVLHFPMVFIMPVFLMGFITRIYGPKRRWSDGFAAWKFCLFSSLAFGIPYILFAWFVGYEPPTLASSIIGFGIIVFGAKRGFCVPKEVFTFGDNSKWEPSWTGTVSVDQSKEPKPSMSQLRAWTPYIIISIVLLLTRIRSLPFFAMINKYLVINVRNILGWPGVSDSGLKFLYLPGSFPFVPVALLVILIHKMPLEKAKQAWKDTFIKIRPAAIAMASSLALVKIFQGSGSFNPTTQAALIERLQALNVNTDILSMPRAMAESLAAPLGSMWPYFASYVGGLGAFITGSNTVSNNLFGQFQWDIATILKYPQTVILAAQAAGGAMGNMICVNNVIAVCSVVGLLKREGEIIRKTFIPFMIYGVVVGLMAYLLLASGIRGILTI